MKWIFSRLQIRIGDTNLAYVKDVKILDVIESTIHPEFKKDIVYFDVAILKTETVNFEPGSNNIYFKH